MRATVLYGPGDVRYEEVTEPKVLRQTDAIINCPQAASAAPTSGPSAASSRSTARRTWVNPNVWFGNVESAAAAIKGYETVQYVSNIYKYYIAYSLIGEKEKPKVTKARNASR